MTDITGTKKSKENIIIYGDWEFDSSGYPATGYSSISAVIGYELQKTHNVIAMGVSYRRNQHLMPFGITMVPFGHFSSAVHSIYTGLNSNLKSVLVTLDIPLQIKVFNALNKPKDMKYTGLFAVEGDPLTFTWAKEIMKFDSRFVISDFGTKQCEKEYIPADHFVVPVNQRLWYPRSAEEKLKAKEHLGLKDKKVLFYNADSNERKNTSALLEALKIIISKDKSVHLILLTRKNSPVGWIYDDLIAQLGITNNITIFDRGIALDQIRELYCSADFYVQPSKAEGLGLPIIEAQSVGVPVIATNCTSMTEHISDGKGIGLEPNFVHIDVWGNSRRYYVFPENIANVILENIDLDHTDKINKSLEYIQNRNRLFMESMEVLRSKI